MKYRFLLCLFLTCSQQAGFSQGDAVTTPRNYSGNSRELIQDQGVLDSLSLWEEKVYLHTDRTHAEAGEAIFFKAYVFNAPTRRRLSPSGVLKLELRDSKNALVA
ncbi:MAG: hypothetical protein P8Z38_09965, partial [Robiginitalea sp.]